MWSGINPICYTWENTIFDDSSPIGNTLSRSSHLNIEISCISPPPFSWCLNSDLKTHAWTYYQPLKPKPCIKVKIPAWRLESQPRGPNLRLKAYPMLSAPLLNLGEWRWVLLAAGHLTLLWLLRHLPVIRSPANTNFWIRSNVGKPFSKLPCLTRKLASSIEKSIGTNFDFDE